MNCGPSEYWQEIRRLSFMSQRMARKTIKDHDWCKYEHSSLRVLEHSPSWRDAWPRPRHEETRVEMICRGARVALMLDVSAEIMRQQKEV